mgnify:CR=1 FL=1
MNISILGAGAWGTALAVALAERQSLLLWGRDPQAIADIAARRENALALLIVRQREQQVFERQIGVTARDRLAKGDVENDFQPYYVVSPGKSKTVSELKSAMPPCGNTMASSSHANRPRPAACNTCWPLELARSRSSTSTNHANRVEPW